jgi:hypothetical protein
MMRFLSSIICFTLTLAATVTCFAQQDIAFRNVHLITMTDSNVQRNQTVVVRKGKIADIIPATARLPRRIRVIDAKGKYMMPGLIDMHMHFYHDHGLPEKYLREELLLPVFNGVTSARIMNGSPLYLRLRDSIMKGKLTGPQLFVASPQIVGKWPFKSKLEGLLVETPEQAVEAVKRFKSEGYHSIKLTMFVSLPVYDAVMAAAREHGMMVTGHVGPHVPLMHAIESGQQIEHYDEFAEYLLADSSANHGRSVSDYGIYNKKDGWPTLEKIDLEKIPALARLIASKGLSNTPTNFFFITFFARGASEEQIQNFRVFPYVPPSHKTYVDAAFKSYWKQPPPQELRTKYIAMRHRITLELYRAGGNLLAGSDGPEWYVAPGFSIHDEMKMFVESGLPPFAALQTATVNPAKYLLLNDRGTIKKGKTADFILLGGNPLEDISNTATVEAVYTREKYYDESQIATMKEQARALGTADPY